MATTINGTAGNDFIQAHADGDYVAGQLIFVLGATPSQGVWPTVNILINGQVVASNLTIDSYVLDGKTQVVSIPVPAGPISSVGIQYTNDLVTDVDDRNVYIGSVTLNGTSLDLASATYLRDGRTTIAGQHDMDWNGTMTWSGAAVQAAGANGTHADNAAIDAGAGQDVVLYQGRASGYTVGYTDTGFTVTPKGGAWGTDTIANTENLLFDDRGTYGSGYVPTAAVDANAGTIDGGLGLDTLYLHGAHSQFLIAHTSTGFSITGPGVQEWVTNVERLAFSDGYIGLDVSGNGGMAYRLYQAAFDRAPDSSGLGYWINVLDSGVSLKTVADVFANSVEFQARYGSTTNLQFVNQLYENVLHRAGESSGVAFWLDVLDSGRDTRAGVLESFSESVENKANLIGVMQDGFFYTIPG